jgi:hypothetical protein
MNRAHIAMILIFAFSLPQLLAQCDTGGGPIDDSDNDGDCSLTELCNETIFHGGGRFCDAYWDCISLCPLVIDLGRDGFRFGGSDEAVLFDLLGDGVPEEIHWVLPDENDAFLFMDLEPNGIVDDGRELFGSGTRLILEEDALALNGFLALAQFDLPELGGNDNGVIDPADDVWSALHLWTDLDADGISTTDEVRDIDESGIRSLGIIPRQRNEIDGHGNGLRYWSYARGRPQQGRRQFEMVDVFFLRVQIGSP